MNEGVKIGDLVRHIDSGDLGLVMRIDGPETCELGPFAAIVSWFGFGLDGKKRFSATSGMCTAEPLGSSGKFRHQDCEIV
tara:strand:- start:29108 stop:29347 length:240 start_codon:yes stop_codon:yes gene_type:complete